jgi:hypothetical protein
MHCNVNIYYARYLLCDPCEMVVQPPPPQRKPKTKNQELATPGWELLLQKADAKE